MQSPLENILENLKAYKRKYYLNKVLKGSILFLAIISGVFIAFNTVEFLGNLSTVFRGFLLFSFLILSISLAYFLVISPIWEIIQNGKKLSDEEAAKQIGNLIPEVKDRLLNTLQLSKISSADNELINASIAQKSADLKVFEFSKAIKLNENKRYLPYLVPPLLLILILLIFIPSLFTESTKRIVQYDQEFVPQAPFKFILQNNQLSQYKNEDFEVKLELQGNSLPEISYIIFNGRRQKMSKIDDSHYTFLFNRLENNLNFQLEAAGYFSSTYEISIISQPVLNDFEVNLQYPSYIQKKNEILINTGNLLVPEGTFINWSFRTEDCDSLFIDFEENKQKAKKSGVFQKSFQVKKQIFKSGKYDITLYNENGSNKEKIAYNLNVIPDEFPKISLKQYRDTTLFNFLAFGGNISDDYGLTELKMFYKVPSKKQNLSFTSDFVEEQETNTQFQSINIKIDKLQHSQSFYFRWDIDSLKLQPGDKLEYYLSVWDNDALHGRKASKTQIFELKIPTLKEVEKSIAESSENAENQLSTTLDKAQELKKDVKKLEQKLKSKRTFDWQDKKALEELINKQQSLQKEMEEMQEKHKELLDKKDRFDKTNERIAEKNKLLQQLMNEMLDEETKKLYNELHKLLQEKGKEMEIKDLVEKIKNKEDNIEKELDRALEMFKQMKVESKMDDIIQKMEDLAQKQEQLAQQTEDKKTEPEKLKEEQEKLNEEFKEAQKEIEELQEMNKELENKQDIPDTEKQEEDINKDQKDSKESLEKKDKNKASKSQKKAAEKMQQMAQEMKKKRQESESEQMEENMEDLRNILENLITLSYEQEDVMKEFKKVNQQDPRFITLSQRQIKIKDDSKIVEDSLNALAKRVFQIQSFIKKELEDMNTYMADASKAIKARRSDMAAGKQQFSMTSMNNLALMLTDVLKQMQEQANEQQQKGGGSGNQKKKSKKNCKSGAPSLSSLQKKLNKQMEDIKKSGMSGQKLSEEMAKMARQQEQIRNAMKKEAGKGMGGNSGSQGQEGQNGEQQGKEGQNKEGKNGKEQGEGAMEQLLKEMEKTEADLVNKQITQQTLDRQQEILSRLLEHENAQREREQDEKRESETAKERNKKVPPSFEQYLKEKEKQVELLKTIPPGLSPYYKREANEYFQKLNN
jgi:hypothetical protein